MAYTAGNLTLLSQGNGFSHYRYDTTEANTSVDAAGYFNNTDDNLNLAVGDIIDVITWGTAVRTGTISDVSRHIITSLDSDGAVHMSVDLLAATVSTGG